MMLVNWYCVPGCYEVKLQQLEALKHIHKVVDPLSFVRKRGYTKYYIYEALQYRLFTKMRSRIMAVFRKC